MTTTLITGADKGLGKATVRLLVVAGHTVWLGARDAARGQAATDELGARFVQLDVTDDTSVAAALTAIQAEGGLDVLINNSGIAKRAGGVAKRSTAAVRSRCSTRTRSGSSGSPRPRCRCLPCSTPKRYPR